MSEPLTALDYEPMGKIARWSRDLVITEKIDGTNGCIHIGEDGSVRAGSKTRWLSRQDDNFGFCAWVEHNAPTLVRLLGPGWHRGEWWGHGIQRGYGLPKGARVFSLFNTHRWEHLTTPHPWAPNRFRTADGLDTEMIAGLTVVPRLYVGPLEEPYGHALAPDRALQDLREAGSYASPGFRDPEGIVIFHKAANVLFKKTLEHDEKGKPE